MSEIPFTPDQLDAINIRQRHLDACVVAGPGSGKTTVLVEYFRRLVEAEVDPLRILAITFTEKAAANMRTKLAKAFEGNPPVRAKLERAWVMTVHGFCARLLKENAVFAGIDPEFRVADANDAWRMQQESFREVIGSMMTEHAEAMRSLIRGLSSYEFDDAVLAAYDAMRCAGVSIFELPTYGKPKGTTVRDVGETLRLLSKESKFGWKPKQQDEWGAAVEGAERMLHASNAAEALRAALAFKVNRTNCKKGNTAYELITKLQKQMEEVLYSLLTDYYAPQRKTLLEIFARFDALYREKKRHLGLLDFSDLEECTVHLLEDHTDARARIQNQFDHILMDEFQDTNQQQNRLMELVRAPQGFYAVGDVNQAIFGFRHAEPKGFQDYLEYIDGCGGHRVELNDNFRSRPAVLAAVETICEGTKGIVDRPLVAHKNFDRERECSVEAMAAADPETEARWVAKRMHELAAEGFKYRQMALLLRNTGVIENFAMAFDAAGVPFVVNQGRGFFETREVNDLTQLLRVIANPRDEVSLAAVLRSPFVGASDEALLALKASSEKINLGAALTTLGPEQAKLLSDDDYSRLQRFRTRLHEWRTRREYVTFDRLLLTAIDDCGYLSQVSKRAAANIDKFLAQARAAARRSSLDGFVEELAALREVNPREVDMAPEDSADAVQVMTVHSAKGLEFPAVFVSALDKGVRNERAVVGFSREHGLGARWRIPGTRKDKNDLYQHALREEAKDREKGESNRLLYVAMTRAEEVLILTWSGEKPKEWASHVAKKLDLEGAQPGEETIVKTAPDGEEWNLRAVMIPEVRQVARPATTTPRETASEAELVAAPASSGQESNATVTHLAKFAVCPREYLLGSYLGYEGRLRKLSDGGGELPANELGTQVHALLAGAPEDGYDEEAVRLANVFRSSPLGRRAERARRIEREFGFLMAVEGMVVRGQIDLWFEEGGELVIVDYKTDAVTAAQAHQRGQDYELQLKLYAQAVERVVGRAPNRACLHFLEPNTIVPVDLTPSLLDSPEQIVRDFLDAHERSDFPMRESDRCQRCAFYRDLCPAGTDSDGN